jgi:hypothetical protein
LRKNLDTLAQHSWLSLALGSALGLSACATWPTLLRDKQGDGQVVATPSGPCIYLAPENALHPLSICEGPTRYEITVPGRRYALEKASLQRQLRERLGALAGPTSYAKAALKAATVELWLTAGAFTPEDAELRAVVISAGGNFAVRLPLDQAAWNVPEAVEWLGAKAWPSRTARQSGVLLAYPPPTVAPEAFKLFVAAALAAPPAKGIKPLPAVRVSGDGTALRLETAPFAEAAVAKQLSSARGARAYLAALRWEPAGEREGYKVRFGKFAFGR